ncbi:hypothetical protein Sjap_010122 [Stephania japonica]|uniref:Uncharacterized protein n=1 Tax=Stephania japonica TaxID=461633 RepID=A0AAP0J9T2_9MAGN
MQRLDDKIGPMLEADGEHFNKRWGYLSRAGLWDKSHLTRQIEKYADIYTSRILNFLHHTPFMYFRSQEQVFEADDETTKHIIEDVAAVAISTDSGEETVKESSKNNEVLSNELSGLQV